MFYSSNDISRRTRLKRSYGRGIGKKTAKSYAALRHGPSALLGKIMPPSKKEGGTEMAG
jgi:hypothetical protein